MNSHYLLPNLPFETYEAYLEEVGATGPLNPSSVDPDALFSEVDRSGLRGRGGAGFPVGRKWRTLREHPCKRRFVVCNAAEGEPGTFKDRYLIRNNPYAVLEGMLMAARSIGTMELYIALKESFRKERKRIEEAITELKDAGLLEGYGVVLIDGPEEYLFGEEKALLNVIEGLGPLPREAHYPPYEIGLFAEFNCAQPALVNNAETYAHIPSIHRLGADSFRQIGSGNTPGTILFTVSGDVRRPGVYEFPAGISLRKLFHEVAGGPPEGRGFKMALPGVSSAPIPASHFDASADFDTLQEVGSGLGSAGFVLYDDTRSAPRIAQMAARFLYVESCNLCWACKAGLGAASRILDRVFGADPFTESDLEGIVLAARSAPSQNRCYLPVQGSLLISSMVQMYKEEFEASVDDSFDDQAVYAIPKMTDFDESMGKFLYDQRQMKKSPNWTYSDE